jgi:hypothetical protein
MATIEFHLFRAKFIRPAQKMLFEEEGSAETLLWKSVMERPSVQLRKGYDWHIGNVERYPGDLASFAIGRVTKSTFEKWDEESKNFIVESTETSPYTHVVAALHYGVLGIAQKHALKTTTKNLANNLARLLAKTKTVRDNDARVEVSLIPDPEGFIRTLQQAVRVSMFEATFTGPNPFDADEYFQKPLSRLLNEASGQKGKAQLRGEDLRREVLVGIAKSTAATGNAAKAKVLKSRGGKWTTQHLSGDPVKVKFEVEGLTQATAAQGVLDRYKRLSQND